MNKNGVHIITLKLDDSLGFYCAMRRSKLTNMTRQLLYVITRLLRRASMLLTTKNCKAGIKIFAILQHKVLSTIFNILRPKICCDIGACNANMIDTFSSKYYANRDKFDR